MLKLRVELLPLRGKLLLFQREELLLLLNGLLALELGCLLRFPRRFRGLHFGLLQLHLVLGELSLSLCCSACQRGNLLGLITIGGNELFELHLSITLRGCWLLWRIPLCKLADLRAKQRGLQRSGDGAGEGTETAEFLHTSLRRLSMRDRSTGLEVSESGSPMLPILSSIRGRFSSLFVFTAVTTTGPFDLDSDGSPELAMGANR